MLFTDPSYQRHVDPIRVQKLVMELDLDALGEICVSQRNNGLYAIIDGQHRVDALRVFGFEEDLVPCEVYKGLRVEEEAVMFRLRNNRVAVGRLDLFRARLIALEPVALGINDIVTENGWTIRPNNVGKASAAHLGCIETIEQIYKQNPDNLRKVLRVITMSWGKTADSGNRAIVGGLGKIFARYGDLVDTSIMIDKLPLFTPKVLLGRARGVADMYRTRVADGMAEIMVLEYNRRLTTNALPQWRQG